MNATELAQTIDSSLLKPTATADEVKKLCELARQYRFATVAVGTAWIPAAAKLLEGSGVGISAPVGFPLGYSTTEVKVFETKDAIDKGASEIDMVINLGFLKSHFYDQLKDEIQQIVQAANGRIVKVIIETSYLNKEEKIKATKLIVDTGARFVKTSTGFSDSGCTVEDIRLLSETANNRIEVKAAGGIRTFDEAVALVRAGATRLGVSSAHRLMVIDN